MPTTSPDPWPFAPERRERLPAPLPGHATSRRHPRSWTAHALASLRHRELGGRVRRERSWEAEEAGRSLIRVRNRRQGPDFGCYLIERVHPNCKSKTCWWTTARLGASTSKYPRGRRRWNDRNFPRTAAADACPAGRTSPVTAVGTSRRRGLSAQQPRHTCRCDRHPDVEFTQAPADPLPGQMHGVLLRARGGRRSNVEPWVRTLDAPHCGSAPTPTLTDEKAGASAQREYERRHAERASKTHARLGALGVLLARVTDEPQTVRAWRKGARGDLRTAERLTKHLEGHAVRVLHDRRVPRRGNANIDHIVVGPAGVLVIDTKTHRGKVKTDWVGGLFAGRRTVLLINGRDQRV